MVRIKGKWQARHKSITINSRNLSLERLTFWWAGRPSRWTRWGTHYCRKSKVHLRQTEEIEGLPKNQSQKSATRKAKVKRWCSEVKVDLWIAAGWVWKLLYQVWGSYEREDAYEAWERPSDCESWQLGNDLQSELRGEQRTWWCHFETSWKQIWNQGCQHICTQDEWLAISYASSYTLQPGR